MNNRVLFICLFLLYASWGLGQAAKQISPESVNSLDKKFFIENKGQWHSDVLYLCRMSGLDAWVTKYGVNYTFYKLEEVTSANKTERYFADKLEDKDYNIIGHRVLMKLQNHNPAPAREGIQKQQGYYNYFIGNDPSKHASYVGLYKEAVLKEVYPGIDIHYYFDQGYLRYDYIVQPWADPSQIVFTLEGSDNTYLNKQGNIVFTTCFGEVALAELKTYQAGDKKSVSSRFVSQGENWRIAVAHYDRSQPLIIDPLVYSTYLGGSNYDRGHGIVVDGNENAYVTGYTQSTNYDVTAGAFQTTYGGGAYDVFVTKLNPTGTGLIYSTYIGGSADDSGLDIALDGGDNVYVTGYTESNNYDVTAGAFQTTYGGGTDAFVTKLNSTGTGLVYSTYIGGSNWDEANRIVVDGSGNAYIVGWIFSTNYDVTAGAFQTTYGGGTSDACVTKLCLDTCVPLPIELLYFNAEPTKNQNNNAKVLISWAIVTETNNDYFIVERSLNGLEFEEVLKVKDAGNSNDMKQYSVLDMFPYTGTSYYRLKQTNSDGNHTYSKVVTVHIDLSTVTWYVYPNPNKGTFTLQTEQGGVFELMDITGRLLSIYTVTNNHEIIHTHLPAGMYIIPERAIGSMQKLVIE